MRNIVKYAYNVLDNIRDITDDALARDIIDEVIIEEHNGNGFWASVHYEPVTPETVKTTHKILVPKEFVMDDKSEFVLDYIKKKYNLKLKNCEMNYVIFALLHELGHHVNDITKLRNEGYNAFNEYHDNGCVLKDELNDKCTEKVNAIRSAYETTIDIIEKTITHPLEKRIMMKQAKDCMDSETNKAYEQAYYDYRQVPEEYEADRLSALYISQLIKARA